MRCSVCGADNLEGAAYCEDCGARLAGVAAPVTQEASVPAAPIAQPTPSVAPYVSPTPTPSPAPAAPRLVRQQRWVGQLRRLRRSKSGRSLVLRRLRSQPHRARPRLVGTGSSSQL